MYRNAFFIHIWPGIARIVTPFASWRLESISLPINVATIPTTGRSKSCRQQMFAAVSQNLVWTKPGLDSFAQIHKSDDALGSLPSGADLTALQKANDGRWYFSLDTFRAIGGVNVGPEDVVAWNGSTYELVFDGSLAGIPAGAAVDALAETPGDGLLLSFDVSIPIGLLVIDDEDLVAWDGTTLSLAFDGSGFGIPAALDLDALDYDASDESLYISFDGGAQLGGVDFDDHEILHFDNVSWTKVAYAGLAESGIGAADLDAMDFVTVSNFIFSDGFETVGSD